MPREDGATNDLTEHLHGLLGVEPGVSRTELRAAYRRRMRTLAARDHGALLDPDRRSMATVLALVYELLTNELTDTERGPNRPSVRTARPPMLPPVDDGSSNTTSDATPRGVDEQQSNRISIKED